MSYEFRLPDIGEGLTDAEIVHWHVSVGDDVTIDQLVVEVETAKTAVEITSTHAGTVLALGGAAGDTINVGDVLFVIGEQTGPPTRESADEPGDDALRRDGPAAPQPLAEVERLRADHTGGTARSPSRPMAMPIVRKLAKEMGVDLRAIEGSGPGGAITRDDVESAARATPSDEFVPLTRMRRAIANHMTESWTTIPHVTVQADIRAESLMTARRQRTPKPYPVEALVAVAVIPLLQHYREFNATLRDDTVKFRDRYNLGFAVDTPAGLLVAVVREADHMSVDNLAAEFERVSGEALDGALAPGDATGQTFTISNIGSLGGGHGTPIIPIGTSAILSIGRATEQPVVEKGKLSVGLVAPIDLSYDHRLIDGGLGQRFLSDLITNLERISSLLA